MVNFETVGFDVLSQKEKEDVAKLLEEHSIKIENKSSLQEALQLTSTISPYQIT